MSFTKGLLAIIGIHLVGVLLVLGVTLGLSWVITRLTGLLWSETAVLLLICLVWAIALQKIFTGGFGVMLFLWAISTLLGFGGGWLLSRWLSFPFFHAGLLPVGAAFAFMYYFFADFKEVREGIEEGDWLDDEDEMPIPRSRFIRTESEQTGEAIFRYIVANAICRRINAAPEVRGSMDGTEVQELSIRLTDAAVSILRRKPVHTQRYQVTVSGLRKVFDKMGQQPYDADILEVAVSAVNTELMLDMELEDIARNRRWSTRLME
ncbi:MAG: hypothetical protein KDE56_14800 [Anaerolineales bacterium]|nr:hypothetical protein [Anaerolineales bacterium]